jgi:N-acetylneuraminic acid mutarotase
MPTPRRALAAAAAGGKVYAIGGYNGSNLNLNEEYDPAANAWISRASMPTPRRQLAAAAVGGKVYAIGGFNNTYRNQNEEYDPASNTWTARAVISTACTNLAVVAVEGKLYALGGSPNLNQNEEYDPASNTWTARAAIPTARSMLAAGVVGGKVYAIGGSNANYLNLNEEFDPTVNSWTTRAAMPTARQYLAAAALGGKLYAVGGSNGTDRNQNEEYDPGVAAVFGSLTPNTLYTFKAKARNSYGVETAESPTVSTYTLALATFPALGLPVFSGVYETSATVNWSSGTAGMGYNAPGASYLAEASPYLDFRVIEGSSLTANLYATVSGLTLPNGLYSFRVRAANIGGRWNDFVVLGSTRTTAPMEAPAVVIDEVFATSITAAAYTPTPGFASLEVGQSGTNIAKDGTWVGWHGGNVWAVRAAMPTARRYFAAAAVGGKLYAVGGSNGTDRNQNEEFDPAANTWTTRAAMPTSRQGSSAGVVEGKLYVVGGNNGSHRNQNEEYDPASNTWTTRAVMPTARGNLAAAVVGGKLFVVGGYNGSYRNQNEEYDHATNSWATRAAMPTARRYFAAAAVGGKLYAVGGFNGGYRDQNEEYDPATNTWTTRAAMPTPRGHLAAAVAGGKLFAIGGDNGSNRDQTEEFDPAVNAWTSRPAMPTARGGLAAVALGGKLYAVGGYNGSQLSQNEEYDPGVATVFGNLTPNTLYTFKAKARNSYGIESTESPAVSTYTLANTPAGSAASGVYSTSATFNWGWNSNPTYTTAEVERSLDGVSYSALMSGATTETLVYDLLGCTTYWLRVRNRNLYGAASAFDTAVEFTTLGSTPAAPGSLSADSLAGGRIRLEWTPSPTEGITGYRLFGDNGTGTVDYGAALASFLADASSHTTGVMTSSAAYRFALRAVHRCGVEERVGVFALAASTSVLAEVRASVGMPTAGQRIDGDRIGVLARLSAGTAERTDRVLFQYKTSAGSAWTDIVPAGSGQSNPDRAAPYFVSWDVSGLAAGSYDLRAVAVSVDESTDTAAPAVTVQVDPLSPTLSESLVAGGLMRKTQLVYNTVANTVQATGTDDRLLSVAVPAGALNGSTATIRITQGSALPAPPPSNAEDMGLATEIELVEGQTQLANSNSAAISFSYPDADFDGRIDGTRRYAEALRLFSYDAGSGQWVQDLGSLVLDASSRTIRGSTRHFSVFAAFAVKAAEDLDSVRVYPTPFKPYGSDPDEGRAYSSGDPNSGIFFDNLPAAVTVKVYTVTGRLLAEFSQADGFGRVRWDARSKDGHELATGVYLAVFSMPGKGSVTRKISIIR